MAANRDELKPPVAERKLFGTDGVRGIANVEPTRTRKLLLHKQEIQKLTSRVQTKGETLIPLRVYFKDSRAKVELALGTGKKSHDKRQAIKERETGRELDRSMRRFKK